MKTGDIKNWKGAATFGLAFTVTGLIVCIIQYYATDADLFHKIIRITMNFIAVNSFFFLFFKPLSFSIWSFAFFVYGCGNFLNDGDVFGALCVFMSFLFLWASGFFKKKRILKTAGFLLLPAACIVIQLPRNGIVAFLMTIMHLIAAGFIFYLTWLVLAPRVEKAYSSKSEKIISSKKFNERDIEFLQLVLNGEKYSKIAFLYNISESSVKAQMLELYHYLGVNSRMEFLAFCNGCTFILGETEGETEN